MTENYPTNNLPTPRKEGPPTPAELDDYYAEYRRRFEEFNPAWELPLPVKLDPRELQPLDSSQQQQEVI